MSEAEMLPCDQVIARLWEYVDGELTEARAEEVRAHLEVCSRCFPQYDFQRAYRVFLRRCAEQPVPPELRQRVFRTLLEESGREEKVPGGLRVLLARLFRRRP
jgi:anti-sigma factor (TIGR02949 family)